MTLSDHIRLIWARPHVSAPTLAEFRFDDGLPPPSQAELDATYGEALAKWNAEREANKKVLTVPGAAFFQAIGMEMEQELRAQVEAIIDPAVRHYTRLFLNYPYFDSNHSAIPTFATMLNKPMAEVYELFKQAFVIAYPARRGELE